MPGLIGRITESRINLTISYWFKSFMVFLFGADSPACSLTPVDLIKSFAVYMSSSGVMYEAIRVYTTSRNHSQAVREAFMAGLVVMMTDLSHRYAGSKNEGQYAFKKVRP
jgi:hypothetical protein